MWLIDVWLMPLRFWASMLEPPAQRVEARVIYITEEQRRRARRRLLRRRRWLTT